MREPKRDPGAEPNRLVKTALALTIAVALAAVATAPAAAAPSVPAGETGVAAADAGGATGAIAADHGGNHCENHGSGVVDWLLDNLKQNLCNHGSTMDGAEIALGAAGSGCAQDCFEDGMS